MRKILYAVNHWTASGPETTIGDIRNWHVNHNGWRDIGYHRIILHPDSDDLKAKDKNNLHWFDLVKQGRQLNEDQWLEYNEVGAHTYGFNSVSVGICVIGGPKYKLHPLQRTALIQTNIILSERFGYPLEAVKCHRDLNKTQCPGDEIAKVIAALKADFYVG